MTERSGAERQPRHQDAGARRHPQPPAAVLAGRPRSLQGRSRPGGGSAAAEPRPPAHGVRGSGGCAGGLRGRAVRVLGCPSGQEREESSVGSGRPRLPGRAGGAVPALSGARAGRAGHSTPRAAHGPGSGPGPQGLSRARRRGTDGRGWRGRALSGAGRCPAAIRPAPGRAAFTAPGGCSSCGEQRGAGSRDRQPPNGNKLVSSESGGVTCRH